MRLHDGMTWVTTGQFQLELPHGSLRMRPDEPEQNDRNSDQPDG